MLIEVQIFFLMKIQTSILLSRYRVSVMSETACPLLNSTFTREEALNLSLFVDEPQFGFHFQIGCYG